MKKRLIAFILAITTFVSVVGCNKKNKNLDNQTSRTTSCATNEIPETTIMLNQPNNGITEEELNNYLSFYNSFTIEYDFEHNYPTYDSTLEKIKISENNVECNYQFNAGIDDIILSIKNNSYVCIEHNPQFTSAFCPKNSINPDANQQLFEECLKKILSSFINQSTNNISEDMCTIKDISIVFGTTGVESEDLICSAFYDHKTRLLVLDTESICYLSKIHDIDYKNLFEIILRHELNHVRQCFCKCRETGGQKNWDITFTGRPSTIIEASADSEILNLNPIIQDNTIFYENEISDESLIILLGLFHDDLTIDDYYDAIFDNDLQKFYQYCGCQNTEDIHELYKILYALDAKNCRNDFYLSFQEALKNMTTDELREKVGYGYKVEIFRKVLENMVKYTCTNGDFTLDENLIMLNVIKTLLVDDTYQYSSDYQRLYDENFVFMMRELEAKYVNFLSAYYNQSAEFIKKYEEERIYNIVNTMTSLYSLSSDDAWMNHHKLEIETIITKFPLLKSVLRVNDFLPLINNEIYEDDYKALVMVKPN